MSIRVMAAMDWPPSASKARKDGVVSDAAKMMTAPMPMPKSASPIHVFCAIPSTMPVVHKTDRFARRMAMCIGAFLASKIRIVPEVIFHSVSMGIAKSVEGKTMKDARTGPHA